MRKPERKFHDAERLLRQGIVPHQGSEKGCMDDEPKRQEPEIMPPVPNMVPGPGVPEIPPDKDAPQRKDPSKGRS